MGKNNMPVNPGIYRLIDMEPEAIGPKSVNLQQWWIL